MQPTPGGTPTVGALRGALREAAPIQKAPLALASRRQRVTGRTSVAGSFALPESRELCGAHCVELSSAWQEVRGRTWAQASLGSSPPDRHLELGRAE